MDGAHETTQPQLCKNGCGFFGNPKTEGMCSVCYKNTLQKKNSSGRISPAISPVSSKRDQMLSSPEATLPNSSVESAMASLDTRDATPTKTPSSSVPATSDSKDAAATGSSTSSDPIAIPSATNPAITLTSFSPPKTGDMSSTSLDASSTSSSPAKSKKIRCAVCRKRVGLTGFLCRCGQHFCSLHRYSDQHDCQFDYKANAQAKIRKENPVVVGEKIKKI